MRKSPVVLATSPQTYTLQAGTKLTTDITHLLDQTLHRVPHDLNSGERIKAINEAIDAIRANATTEINKLRNSLAGLTPSLKDTYDKPPVDQLLVAVQDFQKPDASKPEKYIRNSTIKALEFALKQSDKPQLLGDIVEETPASLQGINKKHPPYNISQTGLSLLEEFLLEHGLFLGMNLSPGTKKAFEEGRMHPPISTDALLIPIRDIQFDEDPRENRLVQRTLHQLNRELKTPVIGDYLSGGSFNIHVSYITSRGHVNGSYIREKTKAAFGKLGLLFDRIFPVDILVEWKRKAKDLRRA